MNSVYFPSTRQSGVVNAGAVLHGNYTSPLLGEKGELEESVLLAHVCAPGVVLP